MDFYDYGYNGFDSSEFMAVLGMVIGFIFIIVGIAAIICLVLYILRSIGLYRLSVNRGMGGAGLAWIPFVGFYRIGSIADDISARNGSKSYYRYILLFGGIFNIIAPTVQSSLMYPSLSQLFESSYGYGYNYDYFGSAARGYSIFSGVGLIISIVSLAVYVITIIALNKIYKCYRPMSSTSWTVLSVIFPFMQSIFPFAIRNAVPIPEWGTQAYYPQQDQGWQTPPPPPPQYPPYMQHQPPVNDGYYPPQYEQTQPQYMPPSPPPPPSANSSYQPPEPTYQPIDTPYQPPESPYQPMDTPYQPLESPYQPIDTSYQPPVAPNPPEPWELDAPAPQPPLEAPWENNDNDRY